MLPALPTPQLPRRGLLTLLLLLALVLPPVGLTGCSGPGQPPHAVLLDALALQIRLTQDAIAEALVLPPAGLPQVSRVRVEEQQTVAIGEGRGLRLAGRFDWRLASDPIRVDSPLEIFLQKGERGESWRLARPIGSGPAAGEELQEWRLDPLPLPGERVRG
ncbi:MAG: hypothetical protein VKI81_04925 [Synechococcaceae cyanobacterium]|nr:hypothetical protein [Synechococcaceae cyanobacterium]